MRMWDLLAGLCGLVLLGPVLLVVALLVRLTSPGPALYRARRIGREGRLFTMYKFRTMRSDAGGPPITAGDADPRITTLGHVLRRYRIDELPQLLNVLCGEMAVVGPRPEDPRFLPHYTPEEREVLAVRPGLTCYAQLVYRDLAERRMPTGEDPAGFYLREVLHPRLAIDRLYLRTRSWRTDLRLILLTVRYLVGMPVHGGDLPAEIAAILDAARHDPTDVV